MSVATGTTVERLEVFARTIPTDEPESDGTLEWDSTTIVVVEAHAAGAAGPYPERAVAPKPQPAGAQLAARMATGVALAAAGVAAVAAVKSRA
jgi:hypothetical protein